MALTLAGVAWAVLETPDRPVPPAHRVRGVLFAFLGAVGQAMGLILSKVGMESLPDAIAATQIRVLAGAVGFAVVATVGRGGWRAVGAGVRDRGGFGWTMLGTLFGPVFGVSASLLAVHETQAGIASAIMSTTPVLILPAVALQGERVSPRAVLGALLAVAGVALLFA
jgi:drug/metabolite transporter (DMT)-like permease